MKEIILDFICFKCGKKFKAKQGSRRKYCDKCLCEIIKAGKKQMRIGHIAEGDEPRTVEELNDIYVHNPCQREGEGNGER